MLDYVREHPILKDTPLVAYGQSIGGAVAIDLVSRNENSFSGLMIENTFLSLVSICFFLILSEIGLWIVLHL